MLTEHFKLGIAIGIAVLISSYEARNKYPLHDPIMISFIIVFSLHLVIDEYTSILQGWISFLEYVTQAIKLVVVISFISLFLSPKFPLATELLPLLSVPVMLAAYGKQLVDALKEAWRSKVNNAGDIEGQGPAAPTGLVPKASCIMKRIVSCFRRCLKKNL